MSTPKNPRIARWFSRKAALTACGKGQALQQSVANRNPPSRFRLLLVGLLALIVAVAPVGRAIAETLEIPQVSPSPTFDSEAQANSSSAPSPGVGAVGSSADYEAQATPTSTPQAQPMPQIAGIDQYMNQGGRASGYPPGSAPDPRNNRANSGGGLLMGGLMGGLMALDLVINHHR